MRPWSEAMAGALYGPDGFYRRERPLDHFRTSSASAVFAQAVRVLAGRVDDALARPDPFDLVDAGAGRGELLSALPDVPTRWRLTAVELQPLDGPFRWLPEVPRLTGLLLAHELLDVVPLDVVQDGRLVLVDPTGAEAAGPAPSPEQQAWLRRWWPGGDRREVGLSRDRAWARLLSRVDRGLAVAVDYAHDAGSRRPTLVGYRSGRLVPPVPDGTCDLTAHVALDSCAAAGGRVLSQREALSALGVSARLPDPLTAAGLQRAAEARTLLDLPGFAWLVAEVGITPVLPVAAGACEWSRDGDRAVRARHAPPEDLL